MRILAIETSCDETAVALLEITGPIEKPEVKVLGNNLYSQAKLHAEFGGVYPTLAKREHMKNLPILLEKTLKEAGEHGEIPNIDFIAVTTGPGLEPALWTGIMFAHEWSKKWSKPVLGINHMEGHIWSILPHGVELPALALLISGGHTELVYIKTFGDYQILGRTKDDAVGEAFDKVARMLGLPYPGGPEISRLANQAREKGLPETFKFPRPMINSGDLNFSFSGLKTAVLYKVKADQRSDEGYKEEVARAFEDAVMDVLVSKTRQALEQYDVKTLIAAGGVAASARVKHSLEKVVPEFPGLTLSVAERTLATDNAVMIGLAAYVRASTNPTILERTYELTAKGNLELGS